MNIPSGYDIIDYTNPAESIVYKQQTACKCCGHNPGMMQSIRREPTREAAEAWLRRHIGQPG